MKYLRRFFRSGGGLMERFVTALAMNDSSKILSGPDTTLESHFTVFAAEKSREEGRAISL